MSDPAPSELLAFLQEQKFLTPTQVQELVRANGTMFADGRTLARELLGRNWLTAYQVNQLLQGQGRELLLGPYRVLDRLGEGGMGQVLKAHHVNMDRVVAIKIIPKERVSDPVAVKRFYREVRAVAKLSHPNIVTAFEVNQVGGTHYLAMEFVDGIDLARLVQQSGPLAIPQACDYIRQAAIALQHAHEKGLVHRDIKPGNLMVARPSPDEAPVIKILDFGLARFESESDHSVRLTQLGNIVGTVDYIAPEQAQNPRTADIRADIYSLGCSLFYLLTGNPPFSGNDAAEKIAARVLGDAPTVRKSRPEVSPALESVVAQMMARNPVERYQTPGEVAKTLRPHVRDERQARRSTAPISNRSVAQTPKSPAVAKASAQTFTPPETAFAILQPDGEFKPRRRAIAPLWIALAGAVALLGILVGVIVLVVNKGGSDSKKGQALAGGDIPIAAKGPGGDDRPKHAEKPKDTEPDRKKDKKDKTDTPEKPAPLPRPLPATWKSLANMPTARSLLAAATGPDGRIYAIGGENASGRLDAVEVYDPGTNKWTTVASMPTARNHLAATMGPDNLIYAIGGVGGANIVEAYDSNTNKWTTVAPMPTARHGMAAVTGPDGRIYAIGGNGSGRSLDTVEAYDTKSDTWTPVASMPTARVYLAAARGPDGRIYAIGGFQEGDGKRLNTVEAYDTKSDSWTTVASMTTARNALAAATGPDGRIYAIGGHTVGAMPNIVEAYNPSANTWTPVTTIPTVRGQLAATTGRGGRIYVIGGGSGSFLNTVEALSFSTSKP